MNSLGRIFRVSIWGESHGSAIGVTIDGVPSGLSISEEDFKCDIERRKSGSYGTTPRQESDIPNILSGVYNGYSTGAPLSIIFYNQNIKSSDYDNFLNHPRPGHADLTVSVKYDGYNDLRGGGHSSGRLTLPVVAAGVVAKKILDKANLNIFAYIKELGGESDKDKFDDIIKRTKEQNDSIGGVVECCVGDVPAGLGEPFFDSVESVLSHALFAIPAVRGIEFGEGFGAAKQNGSHHNDCFISSNGATATNHCGGVNGGITNGNDIVFRVAFKPTSSIVKEQNTYHFTEKRIKPLVGVGRHDVALVLRTPVIVEAVTAIVLADFLLVNNNTKL